MSDLDDARERRRKVWCPYCKAEALREKLGGKA